MVTKVVKKPPTGWNTSWNRMDCVSASARPRRIDGARIGTNAGSVWDDRASHLYSRLSLKLFQREILRATASSAQSREILRATARVTTQPYTTPAPTVIVSCDYHLPRCRHYRRKRCVRLRDSNTAYCHPHPLTGRS